MHLIGSRRLSHTAADPTPAVDPCAAHASQAEDARNALQPDLAGETSYRVLVADDHSLFRAALVECVRRTIRTVEIVEAWDLVSLQAAVTVSTEFDLLLLDLYLPGINDLSALVHMHALAPGIAVIVVSHVDDVALVSRAIALGAAGFIAKSSPMSTIAKALTTVLAGGISISQGDSHHKLQGNRLSAAEINAARRVSALTPQQYRISMLLTCGMHNEKIAWELGITLASVKAQISSILQTMQVRRRTQVARLIQTLDFERSGPMQSYGLDWRVL